MPHTVMFVSLGPGDAELITLKGLRELQNADIIFCPSTVLPSGRIASRAKDILLQLGIDDSKINTFAVPMNKDRSLAIGSYGSVSQTIAGKYAGGLKVAVTAEGDAGFYSTIYYICENLRKENIPVARIAGVPAFIACGTLANIHIVKQEEEMHVVPGMVAADDLKARLQDDKTIVVMKASQCQPAIKSLLGEPGFVFHYFENVGIEGKEYYTSDSGEIAKRVFPYFSVLIIQNRK